jgi:cardiolipin synthase
VDVTIVMPKVSDSPLVAAASRSHYIDLLEAGVKILHYRGGLLHAKTVTVDRDIALIGSANFDARSFWLNFEVTVFIYDDDFASAMRFMQSDYIAQSDQVHLAEWKQRSRWEAFRDNAAQLLGPLL